MHVATTSPASHHTAVVAVDQKKSATQTHPAQLRAQERHATPRTDLDILRAQRDFRGAAVQVYAHAPAVALPPGADAEQAAEAVTHAHAYARRRSRCRAQAQSRSHPERIDLIAP